MYGFQILYAGNDRSAMIVMSNTGSANRRDQTDRLAEDLAGLILERKRAKYTLGIAINVDDAGVKVEEVVPGGPADRAGIRAGDVLLKVAGKQLGDRPAMTLNAALETGEAFDIDVNHGGERKTLRVKPVPR